MTRVHVMVEGPTEEAFVREVLYPHLTNLGVFLNPILLRTSARGKGGVVSYGKVRHQVSRQCRSDSGAMVTTMIDLYALPGDFPGRSECAGKPLYERVACLEAAFQADIGCGNFLPFLAVHEFEALLFSDLNKFTGFLNDGEAVERLRLSVEGFETPEHVNDDPATAPSKRILAELGGVYQKPLHGPLIAIDIGLDRMRERCAHFHEWVSKLEALTDAQ